MMLTDLAKAAENIADALSKFKTPVPEHAPDITDSISELYGIGSHLRDIHTVLGPGTYSSDPRPVRQDLNMVCSKLNATLEDIFHILGGIGGGSRVLNAGMYEQTWSEISWFFRHNGQMTLRACLGAYRNLISDLASTLQSESARKPLIDPRADIPSLGPAPDMLADGLNGMSLAPKGSLTKPRSYERPRLHKPPPLQLDPPDITPPTAPDVPTSPSMATQATSQSSSTDQECEHWGTRVFRDTSTTPLPKTRDGSKCYGESTTMEMRNHLKEDFEEILEFSLTGQSRLTARLYHRQPDHRARILCKWLRSCGGGTKYACAALNELRFRRVDSALQICTRRPGKTKAELWARLVFTTIERLVICHCTLLSLRAHDEAKPANNIDDYQLDGELEVFAGLIIDDGFRHALSVCRDRDSKAVRLQASVHEGEMKRTPVWTAFITHYLVSKTWLRRPSPRLVHLRELRRHVFSPHYEPEMTPRGEHALAFASGSDADAFVQTIHDLAARCAGPPPLQQQQQQQQQPQRPAQQMGPVPLPPPHHYPPHF